MASSPFRIFRKHQKVFFAGLTILCMVTFVMCGSMGQGDFFNAIANVFTGRSRAGAVATLYGKDISPKEIQELRSQRRLASQYMYDATMTARNQLIGEVYEASNRWDDRSRKIVEQLVGLRNRSARDPRYLSQYPQALQITLQFYLPQLHASFRQANKTNEANLIEAFGKTLEQELKQFTRPGNQLYFGGTMSLEDTLDFMIWRHEADRRGIQLANKEVSELILGETNNRGISRSDQKNIEDKLRQTTHNFSPDSFRTALADEFRVRIAKSALMGNEQPDPNFPTSWTTPYLNVPTTFATPYEFWQYYIDNRTENVLAVLPVPVRNKGFLAQVGQPSEKDLKELFEKYKDREYQDGSPDPGFKVPLRVEIEWISANADSEHYRREATRAAALIQAGFQVMAGGGQTISGSVAADATAAALPWVFDFALINQYQMEQYRLRNPSWTDDWNKFLNPNLHESSIRRATNVAATIGEGLGSSATQAPVLSSYITYLGSAVLAETRDRGSIGTTMIGSTAALAPANLASLVSAALVSYGSANPPFIPLSEVKNQLTEKLQQDMAKKLVQTELADLEKELRTLTAEIRDRSSISQAVNRPEVVAAVVGQFCGGPATGCPAGVASLITLDTPVINRYVQAGREALVTVLAGPNPYPLLASSLPTLEKIRKAIDQAVARHGFQHGTTAKPETRDSIAGDPGLKAFKAAYLRDPQNRDPQEKKFANQLFQSSLPYSPQQWLGTDSDQSFAYWKTNDKAAYVPTFAEVQDKAKDWWQMDKARQLAEKEAEELKAKAQGQPDAERWLKDGTKHSEPMFTLDEVAALVKPRTPFAGGSFNNAYQPYVIPPEKIEYPAVGLEKDLLDLKEVGQVIVRSNRPKTIYYIITLVKRTKPSELAFSREYGAGPDSLLGSMEKEIGTIPDKVQASPVPTAETFAGSSTLSSINGIYNGLNLTFISGNLKGQTQKITSYVGETRQFSFSKPWTSAPEAGDAFQITDALLIQLRQEAHLKINEKNRELVDKPERSEE